jgi:hypothetical protein
LQAQVGVVVKLGAFDPRPQIGLSAGVGPEKIVASFTTQINVP